MSELANAILLAPPVLMVGAMLAAVSQSRRSPARWLAVEFAPFAALLLALAGLLQFVTSGAVAETLALGLVRIDPVSISVAVLVSFVGFVVMRYARTALQGEAGESRFHALMLFTLGAALTLVLAGTLLVIALAFIAIGWSLNLLLLTYPGRKQAQRAAAKFRLVWAAADIALLVGTCLAALSFGGVDLHQLDTASATAASSLTGQLAIGLIVIALMMKTACLPLHGWLTEVMEAPTPVSALLHAGIINAGGYVLIRLADLVQQAPWAMALLVMVGGITALFGALVMLTQSAVKTGLAWSTVSQMGFLLLQCGLGLWPLAVLHIVAHSLYKAHAFLGAGEAIKASLISRRLGPVAAPHPGAVARAFGVALALYILLAIAAHFVLGDKPAQAIALGAILIFGIAYLMAQGFAESAPRALARLTTVYAAGAALAYFVFHGAAEKLWGTTLPPPPQMGALEWALISLALVSFGLVAIAQSLFPLWAHHPATAGLRVHLANGLYLNAALDRAIGGLKAAPTSSPMGGQNAA